MFSAIFNGPRSGHLRAPVPVVRRRHSLAPETVPARPPSPPGTRQPPQQGLSSATAAATPPTMRQRRNAAAVVIPSIPPRVALQSSRRSLSIFSSAINGAASITASSHQHSAGAIDTKIEQAMDLVKTHLMFAVREEVDSLRAKILELETTVIQLEAENSILREHVPSEILQNLSLHSAPSEGNSAAMAVQ